jgi:tetratricopeptide (TPR) repeat protein
MQKSPPRLFRESGSVTSPEMNYPSGGRRRNFALALGGLAAVLGFFLAQDSVGTTIDWLALRMPGGDKVFHCAEFFVLFVVLDRLVGLLFQGGEVRFVLVTSAGFVLAAGDEVHQAFVPGRSVELADFLANVCGLSLGAVLTRTEWRRLSRATVAAVALVVVSALALHSYFELRDFNRGQLYERQGQLGQARRAYLRALSSGLQSAGLFNSLGWVEIESGEGLPEKAVEYSAKALAIRPTDPDILDTHGWALHHAGRHEEALRQLLAAYAEKPRMFCIHYHLAMVYLAQGRRTEALEHLRAQVQAAPRANETRKAVEVIERLSRSPGGSSSLQ